MEGQHDITPECFECTWHQRDDRTKPAPRLSACNGAWLSRCVYAISFSLNLLISAEISWPRCDSDSSPLHHALRASESPIYVHAEKRPTYEQVFGTGLRRTSAEMENDNRAENYACEQVILQPYIERAKRPPAGALYVLYTTVIDASSDDIWTIASFFFVGMIPISATTKDWGHKPSAPRGHDES
jgi:hypothetical protein